jgi:hypothetical protein
MENQTLGQITAGVDQEGIGRTASLITVTAFVRLGDSIIVLGHSCKVESI